MNVKGEEQYFIGVIEKFHDEYGCKNLTEFCREQKVSYDKMVHYMRKHLCSQDAIDAKENIEEGVSIHPLFVERHEKVTPIIEEPSTSSPLSLGEVEMSFHEESDEHYFIRWLFCFVSLFSIIFIIAVAIPVVHFIN